MDRGKSREAPPGNDDMKDTAETADLHPFSPGIVIAGKFALRQRVASGAMGSVFEAWDLFVERKVAVKLMHPHLGRLPELVARFRREAQAAARIQHPNVVTVHEVGRRRDGSFYIVHELLSGRTLREHAQKNGPLSPEEALAIVVPIAGGLAAAHACGIVHRDVKPENIVLCHAPNGELVPKIIDFGVAKVNDAEMLTGAGVLMGTPHYMSPEQAGGDPVDAQSDVWALGVVLYELLAGALPFEGHSTEAVIYKILTATPPRIESLAPNVTSPLATAIHRALTLDPTARTPDMETMRAELARAELLLRHASLAAEPTVAASAPAGVAIPRDNVIIHELVGDFDPPTIRREASPEAMSIEDDEPTQQRERPPEKPEWEWQDETPDHGPRGLDLVENAARALGVNALGDALRWATLALGALDEGSPKVGSALLIAAIASHWLGQQKKALDYAERALRRATRGGAAWHAAFGQVVLASGELGREERLSEATTELERAAGREAEPSEFPIVSACRLAAQFARVGRSQLARRLFRDASRRAEALSVGLSCRAWLSVAASAIAELDGDLAASARSLHFAAEHFTSVSDVRCACLSRAEMGGLLLRLGAFRHAEAAFEETLATAAPMKLHFVATARIHHARALAALGRAPEAIDEIEAVLEERRSLGDARGVALSLLHLARLRGARGETDRALALAKEADQRGEDPRLRAPILAVMAEHLLARGLSEIALELAAQAVDLVKALESPGELEPFVRTIHAFALARAGRDVAARRAIAEARGSLLARASCIEDESFRTSFLRAVPDHAKLLHHAERWLGPE
ncbi:serine/threonine-protein kinase [Polyangium sp. 6x1]|uniref:serine/threonine-protein kinase n=1 Tax=Polyangium sp. 6x1 TaxID=3042689 RepID=UPI0024832AA9|nr:serine/threonine-protein kinase [Polyangium sp. 6x1]MDI1442767.1 serine/threonine-protein kinase [Polyangium sp. 6x1]